MTHNKPPTKRWPFYSAFCVTIMAILGMSVTLGATAARPAAVDWPEIELTQIVGGFSNPVHLTHAGDGSGRLFVVEQDGVIKIVKNGVVEATPFLNIDPRVNSGCSECGLLSVAFPPDFANDGYFFVYYNANGNPVDLPPTDPERDPEPGNDSIIARFKVSANPDVADPASEEQILLVNQPHTNHNGGQLAFGKDGYLYIGLGDGGSGDDPDNFGQRRNTLLGKILRLSVGISGTYSIPSDNPYAQSNDPNIRKEIWSYGWRNPWRFSFDSTTGDMYIGDVGQGAREEFDYEPVGQSGRNYGWKITEGKICRPGGADPCDKTGLTEPIFDYGRSLGSTISGGVVYRGTEFERMKGVYFFGDFGSGRLWGAKVDNGNWEIQELLETGYSISSFGQDEAGNSYLVNYGGQIYRLRDKNPTATSTPVPTPPVNLNEKFYFPLVAK